MHRGCFQAIFNESDNVCYVNLTLGYGRKGVEFSMAPSSCGRSEDPRSASQRVPPDCCLELFFPALSAPRWPGRLRFRVLDAVYGFLASMQRGPFGSLDTANSKAGTTQNEGRSNFRFRAGTTLSRRTAGSGGYFLVRRSFRMASSASMISSRDARLLLKLSLRLKAFVGALNAKT